MKTFLHRCLLSLCISVLASGPAEAAEESLYDRATARGLKQDEQQLFGSKSANYRYDARMIRAAKIASARAHRRSTSKCWRYVKQALLAAKAIDSYPKTVYAKEAATELPRDYGFKKLRIRNPYRAPVGAVLVYGGQDAGHVEIRTENGFVSDFASATPYLIRPLIGVYIKPRT